MLLGTSIVQAEGYNQDIVSNNGDYYVWIKQNDSFYTNCSVVTTTGSTNIIKLYSRTLTFSDGSIMSHSGKNVIKAGNISIIANSKKKYCR